MENEKINLLEGQQETLQDDKHVKRWHRIFIFSIIFFILVLVLGIIRFVATEYAPNDPLAYDAITLEPKKPDSFFSKLKQLVFHKEATLEGERNDRINVLILGMGGPGHDGPYLSDTIIIGSIKPSTNQIAMVSIPRDLGVQIPGYGWQKINHANAYGESSQPSSGAGFATEVIENTFDMDIHYYIRVDFQAFKEIIDEVGGIMVNVERTFVDYMYPAPNEEYQTISFNSGIQKMDGNKALIYARSRHGSNGEGSDFARAARQQKVILALKEKVLSYSTWLNPVKIYNIMNSLDFHITTNMQFSDIINFAKMSKELDTKNIITVVLDNSSNGYLENAYGAGGAFMLKPKNNDFTEINNLIKNIFESDLTKNDDTPIQDEPDYSYANIEIKNATWNAGLAARMKKRLEDRGFYVASIGNTDERPIDDSGIYVIGKNKYPEIVSALEEELHIRKMNNFPTYASATDKTEILIILGEDFNEQ